MLILTLVGCGIGAAVSILGGMSIESWAESVGRYEPQITYGQQFGMIIVPMCVAIGAATGFSAAVGCLRRPLLAVIMLAIIAVSGWALISSMWNSQIAEYGSDQSEMVLYYPPTAMCLIALGVAGLVVAAALAATVVGWISRFNRYCWAH